MRLDVEPESGVHLRRSRVDKVREAVVKTVTMTTKMFQMKNCGRLDALQAAENAGCLAWLFLKASSWVFVHV